MEQAVLSSRAVWYHQYTDKPLDKHVCQRVYQRRHSHNVGETVKRGPQTGKLQGDLDKVPVGGSPASGQERNQLIVLHKERELFECPAQQKGTI